MNKKAILAALAVIIAVITAACTHVSPAAVTSIPGSLSGVVREGQPMQCGSFLPPITFITSTGTVTPVPTVPPAPTATPVAPLVGTTVKLLKSGVEIASTTTAADGSYSFANLTAADDYQLKVFFPGYSRRTFGYFAVADGEDKALADLGETFISVPGELLVRFEDGVLYADAVAALAKYGCIDHDNYGDYIVGQFMYIEFPNDKTIYEMIELLNADPVIKQASENLYYCIN